MIYQFVLLREFLNINLITITWNKVKWTKNMNNFRRKCTWKKYCYSCNIGTDHLCIYFLRYQRFLIRLVNFEFKEMRNILFTSFHHIVLLKISDMKCHELKQIECNNQRQQRSLHSKRDTSSRVLLSNFHNWADQVLRLISFIYLANCVNLIF